MNFLVVEVTVLFDNSVRVNSRNEYGKISTSFFKSKGFTYCSSMR